jgi:hypothetical protein
MGKRTRIKHLSELDARRAFYAAGIAAPTPEQIKGFQDINPEVQKMQRVLQLCEPSAPKANNPQRSWGFEGEPPKAVMKDSGTRDGTL